MISPTHTTPLGQGCCAELLLHAPAADPPRVTLRVKRGARTLRRYVGPWTFTALRAQPPLLRQAADALLACGAPPLSRQIPLTPRSPHAC